MIKIDRQKRPDLLRKNKDRWTKELLSYIKGGKEVPKRIFRRYRHPEIKEAVKHDSYEKCIYCESKVSHVYPGDVEHIRPKSKYPEGTFEWENLGYVCFECNNRKRDEYNEESPFINPYEEEPSDFLRALGAVIYHRPGNVRGEITEKTLGLNRSALLDMRRERIDDLRTLLDKYMYSSNETHKKLLLLEIKEQISDIKPYAMAVRSVAYGLLGETEFK